MEGVPAESYAGARRALRPRRARGAGARGRARRAGAADRRRAARTCWPRSRSPPRREQARSIGDVLLRRTRLGLLAARELTADPDAAGRRRRAVRRVGEVLARELALGRAAPRSRARALRRGGRRRGDSRSRASPRPRPPGEPERRPRAVSAPLRRLRAVDLTLELGARPLLMGIVNASPDSFSDGGLHADARRAASRSPRELLADGRRHPRRRRRVGLHRAPAGRRRGGDRARRAAGRARSSASSARSSRSTPTSRRSRARRSPPARGSSTTSAACATRSWPRSAPRPAPRWCVMHTRAAPRERLQDPDLYEDVVAEVLALPARADRARRSRPASRASS